jgi:hypothetical protein
LKSRTGWFGASAPPPDALWAYISVRDLNLRKQPKSLSLDRKQNIAQWETGLVEGALRDDLCAGGGPSLIGWSVNGMPDGVADASYALGQRYPNPSAWEFRKRVELVGRRYGFRVVSLRLLRPEQLAPLLIVETTRPRPAFAASVSGIMSLLDPSVRAGRRTAETFEGFYFEARNAQGPFLSTSYTRRGGGMGGSEWSLNGCFYPYPVIGLITHPKPCPKN